jgi:hypothetical protein
MRSASGVVKKVTIDPNVQIHHFATTVRPKAIWHLIVRISTRGG